MLSLLVWPTVITLSGNYTFYVNKNTNTIILQVFFLRVNKHVQILTLIVKSDNHLIIENSRWQESTVIEEPGLVTNYDIEL